MPNEPTPTPVAATPPEEPRRPDPLAAAVAEGVVRLRREAGLSERAAARKLGTSQTQLRRMEDPRYLPSLRTLARLATVYGYELKVDFSPRGAAAPMEAASRVAGPQKAARTRSKDAAVKTRSGSKAATPRKRVSGSGSPSKARAGAPRRGRAGARAKARRAAPKRRS